MIRAVWIGGAFLTGVALAVLYVTFFVQASTGFYCP